METSLGAPTPFKRLFANSWLHPLHIARRSLRAALLSARDYLRGITLDIGCGNKRYRNLFPNIAHYVGMDLPSNSAFEHNVSTWGDGRFLPFAPRTFDSILCTEVIEHIPTPALLFAEATRVLKIGGYLVLTTPQTWGLHEAPHDYYRYTEYGLRFLAESAGLTVVQVVPTCGVWATAGQRLSSFIFFEFGAKHSLIVQGIVAAVCAVWQIIFVALDTLFNHRGDPLDHLLIARKDLR